MGLQDVGEGRDWIEVEHDGMLRCWQTEWVFGGG